MRQGLSRFVLFNVNGNRGRLPLDLNTQKLNFPPAARAIVQEIGAQLVWTAATAVAADGDNSPAGLESEQTS